MRDDERSSEEVDFWLDVTAHEVLWRLYVRATKRRMAIAEREARMERERERVEREERERDRLAAAAAAAEKEQEEMEMEMAAYEAEVAALGFGHRSLGKLPVVLLFACKCVVNAHFLRAHFHDSALWHSKCLLFVISCITHSHHH
jgi:hypothetical protein